MKNAIEQDDRDTHEKLKQLARDTFDQNCWSLDVAYDTWSENGIRKDNIGGFVVHDGYNTKKQSSERCNSPSERGAIDRCTK